MRLSQAETLCPEARFLPADEEAYDAVHQKLVDMARRFTSTVETDDLGLVYASIPSSKWGDEDDAGIVGPLIEEAGQTLPLDVQIGVASGKFVAHQAARAAKTGEACTVPPGEEGAFLSPLDLSTLPLDPEMERRLRLLGVRTLGALAQLPRPAVCRQFGSTAGALYDLARGEDARPIQADAPPLRLVRSHSFMNPISDRKPLLAHVERIMDDLAGEIERRGYQAEGLLLAIEESEGGQHEIGKPVKPPSSDADHLSRLGARMVGSLTVGGPVTGLSVTLYPLRPFHLGAKQLTLFNSTASAPRATFGRTLRETLRRLWDRFGELSILVASLVVAPAPRPLQVMTDLDGSPRSVVWRERLWKVRSIYEHWRERRRWWGRLIERDYFRLEVEQGSTQSPRSTQSPGSTQSSGRMKVIFHDVQADQWYMERRYI